MSEGEGVIVSVDGVVLDQLDGSVSGVEGAGNLVLPLGFSEVKAAARVRPLPHRHSESSIE